MKTRLTRLGVVLALNYRHALDPRVRRNARGQRQRSLCGPEDHSDAGDSTGSHAAAVQLRLSTRLYRGLIAARLPRA